MTKLLKRVVFIIYDILAIVLSTILALLLTGSKIQSNISFYLIYCLAGSVLLVILNLIFNLYGFSEDYASVYELLAIVIVGLIYGGASILFAFITRRAYTSIPFIVNNTMILIFLEGFSRFIIRFYKTIRSGSINLFRSHYNNLEKDNCLIIGAGVAGSMIAKDLNQNNSTNLNLIGFIDDDRTKLGTFIYGVKVRGTRDDIIRISKEYDVKQILVCIPSLSKDVQTSILNICNKTNAKVLVLPGVYDLINQKITTKNLRHVSIEDLLGRNEINVIDDNTINFYKDKTVLVTGGGGSIGSELCRQIAKMNPKKIIILDIYENCAYEISQELKMKYKSSLDLIVEICSITNKIALERVFKEYKPNIVIMAAAHKHVPLMEHNIIEAVENNVFGTLNTIMLSEKYKVERVHMVSTDKAVNPTSVMGATKRICEMMCLAYSNQKSVTTYSVTRFGNVLGSAGSVIPLFKKQIKEGGPITLTDKRIVRYFMTIPEASSLVLVSSALAKNGELFVLDMGDAVKIYDLALNLIKLSGLTEDDIKIVETGLRPGEKLYEELLVKTEELDKTSNKLIFIERDKPLSIDKINDIINRLNEGIKSNNDEFMKSIIKEVVPTFIDNTIANKLVK